jgi:CsoR family transcriptional regulator, copper-sensing transcriptional repressor
MRQKRRREAFWRMPRKNHDAPHVLRKKTLPTPGEGEYTGRMLDDMQQQSIVTRLNRVEGQIRGIRRMVQEPRLCVEILQQLSAAEAALNRISLAVFKFHVERCVPEGVVQGDPERTKRLTELVDIFDRFSK